ncbi:hypothetical protein [uncultured Chryseobacterium sp.]|uniref:hypothetical protein n=1 Tax=uncultured Chryseobacterium sp. TaxID=259322 RepID=UPI0025844809|nr:hypothetical protein [uncultured Chryseobacterium sp.]
MENNLLSEFISPENTAKVIVLFGGNPYRRDEIISELIKLGNITVYGTLSEEEGMRFLTKVEKIDLVLIGGRYTNEQRIRIRSFIKINLPGTKITEPGIDYPYGNDEIVEDVKNKLQL